MESADGMNVTPTEVRARLDAGENLVLVDVRTPMEDQIGRIEGATLIPVMEIPQRFGEIERDADVVIYCHHGPRAIQAVGFLRAQGYERVYNLAGGIDAWSAEVDSSIPRY